MSDLTVSNQPKQILEQLAATILAARIDGQALAQRCKIVTDLAQAWADHLHGPDAIILLQLDRTRESPAPEGRIVLSIFISANVCFRSGGIDQKPDTDKALYLQAGLINSVQADPPTALVSTSDGRHFFPALSWGPAKMRSSVPAPWRCLEVPIEATALLASGLDH
jgi:hypothetical protein